jgi:hypothetical protein
VFTFCAVAQAAAISTVKAPSNIGDLLLFVSGMCLDSMMCHALAMRDGLMKNRWWWGELN